MHSPPIRSLRDRAAGRPDSGWLAACRDAIGDAHVDDDPHICGRLADAGFASSRRVTARLRPGTIAEVQACLAIASRHGQALYPVSRGRNWGFGSSAPARDLCAILDLSRMDAIVDFDEQAGTITVEPGTTFAGVHAFLAELGSKYFLPAIGGPPDASVIGNAMERGHGIGPLPHRADALGSMQVLLADGTLIETGYKSAAHHAGPSWAGLFLQSNLGIVVRATFTLERRPASLCCFQARVPSSRLGMLLELLVDARRRGVAARSAIAVWNASKVLATGGTAASGEWLLSGAIYAPSRAHSELDRAALDESLAPATGNLTAAFSSPEQPIAGAERFLGVPSEHNLQCLRWRNPERIGVIWICPLIAANPAGADVLLRLERSILQHGFEPQIGMVVDDRPLTEAFASIVYDRAVAGEDDRAMRCHDDAVAMLGELVVPLYRLGLPSMHVAFAGAEWTQRIRRALDPSETIAPGRYIDYTGGILVEPMRIELTTS